MGRAAAARARAKGYDPAEVSTKDLKASFEADWRAVASYHYNPISKDIVELHYVRGFKTAGYP